MKKLVLLFVLSLGVYGQTPFQPAPLTPAQEQEIADRVLATKQLVIIDEDIKDAQDQLTQLYNLWVINSQPLPEQPPSDSKIPTRERIAALYHAEFDYLNALVIYRGAVLGWKRNAGQPEHPKDMPTFTNKSPVDTQLPAAGPVNWSFTKS